MSKLNFHGAGAAAKLPNGAAAVFLQNAHGRPCWTWTASMWQSMAQLFVLEKKVRSNFFF